MQPKRQLDKRRHWVEQGFPKMRQLTTGKEETVVGILCLGCGAISYNQNDIKNFYCANCHLFGSLLT